MSDNTIPSARARLTWQDDNGAQDYLIRNTQTIVIGRLRDNTLRAQSGAKRPHLR